SEHPDRERDQAEHAAAGQGQPEDDAGHAGEYDEEGAEINDPTPRGAGIAAAMEIVEPGGEIVGFVMQLRAPIGVFDFHFPELAVLLEGDRNAVIARIVVSHRAGYMPRGTRILYDTEGIAFCEEVGRNYAFAIGHARTGGAEPFFVIDGETGDAEEQHDQQP